MCLPKSSYAIAGWPAHDEAPRWVGGPLTHLLYAAGCPHLTHSDLGLYLKMGGGPTEDTMCFSKLNRNILIMVYLYSLSHLYNLRTSQNILKYILYFLA